MDLSQLADLGEFVGGVAVLVTLTYLAIQMRQGVRQSSVNVQQSILTDFTAAASEVIGSRSLTELVLKLESASGDFDPVESRQALAYVNRLITIWHSVQQARDRGLVTQTFFEIVRCSVEHQASFPTFRTYALQVMNVYPLAREMPIFRALYREERGS